jgi:hypothetical protein
MGVRVVDTVMSPYLQEMKRYEKDKTEKVQFNTNNDYQANIVKQYNTSQMNRVKYATLVEMMQGVSDDEATMSNKKFTGVLPKIQQDSIASTANVTRDKKFNDDQSSLETHFNRKT